MRLLERCRPPRGNSLVLALVLSLASASALKAADTLNWRTNVARVTADIQAQPLGTLLKQIAETTGWHVFLEPGTTHTVSAKFKDLPPGEALRLLLGDLNFALIPETNAASRLFVFRTTMQKATERVIPNRHARIIPNELIVRLKPGANIEEVARLLGAKVIGRLDKFNTYRLEFENEAAADAARKQLAAMPDVAAVDSNFWMDRPSPPREVGGTPIPPVQLRLNPPPSNGRVIVGLVDTAVQPLGGELDSFLLKPLSVAGDPQLEPDFPSHGTSMAETILRSLQAITKGTTSVQILPVDVYGASPSTTTFDVANGIVRAVNGGANVINLSLGSEEDSPFLHGLIQEVTKQGIPIFAAAGNQPVTTPFYPAAYPEVLAVTAIDRGQLAPYASRGSFVSLGAPGTSIIYYNNQPYYVVGTSAAAAFASGIAAGYMDTTHSSADKMQAFIRDTFGLKSGTATGPPSSNGN